LLGTTLDFSKELGELSNRLVGRVLTFGLHESLDERSPDPLVDVERQSAQPVEGPAMSSDLLLVRQQTFHQFVVLCLERLECGGHVLGCIVVVPDSRSTKGVAWGSSRSYLDRRQACFARRLPVRPWRGTVRQLREPAVPSGDRRMGAHEGPGPRPSVSLTRGSRCEEIFSTAPPAGGRHREPAAYACEAASRCWRRRRARR